MPRCPRCGSSDVSEIDKDISQWICGNCDNVHDLSYLLIDDLNFVGWYTLPESVRKKLESISSVFYCMKDSGQWCVPKGHYEPEAFIVQRRPGTIFIEHMTRIADALKTNPSLRVAIFPVGVEGMDMVFYQKEAK